MKTVSFAVASLLLTAAAAAAQENIFATNAGGGSVTSIDSATNTVLTTAVPNPIPVGAAPTPIIYDPARNLIYVVNGGPGTISVIDPNFFTVQKTIQLPDAANLGGATMSLDGQVLYVSGFENIPKRAAVFQLDLNNLSNAGAKLVSGLTPGDGRSPSDVEVLSNRAYMLVQSQLYQIDLPPSGPNAAVLVPPVAGTNPPSGPNKMARSLNGQFILLTSTSNNALGSLWQVIRLNPGAVPQLDFFQINNTGNAGNSIDDVLFLPTGAAAILARDDGAIKVVTFSVGPTGGASGVVIGDVMSSQWGSGFAYDAARNRYLISANGSTGSPNDYLVWTPGAAVKVTQFTSGANSPKGFAFAPKPPPMRINEVTQPAGIVSATFQLDILGQGYIQGASIARIITPAGVPTIATATQVLSSGEILATFPAPAPATNFDVAVHNNDGQISTLASFFQGLNANPPSPPFTVSLPSLTAGYSMLSFPQYASVGDLRAGVAGQLGTYNPVLFRLFLWTGKNYLELNDPRLSSSESIMGTGFFALTRLGDSLTLSAPDVAANTTGGNRVVALQPGFNLISQPWLRLGNSITLAALQVTANQDLSGQVPVLGSGLLTDVVFEAVNGKYQTTTTMTAGKAYWTLNLTGGPLYLVFNQASVLKPSGPAPAPSAPSGVTPPPMPGEALNDSGGGGGGGCGLIGPELLLLALFLRGRGRRRLAA